MSDSKYKCPLCGFEFDKSELKCHSCPMSASCNVICCPNCGYGFPGQSRVVEWLKKRFKSVKSTADKEN